MFLCNAPFANTHPEHRSNCTGATSSPTKAASPRKKPLSPNVSILNTPRCVSRTFWIPSCVLSSLNVAKSAYHPKAHLTHVILSVNVTRMKIRVWKRCRKRRKTRKVRYTQFTHHCTQWHNITFLLALSFWQPSTPSQREHASPRGHSLSCSPTPKHPPALHSPPLTTRPRRGADPTVSASASTVTLPTISRYRSARGCDDDEPPALNAEFEIDPAANAGVPFAFDEIVRGRRHRHRLIAGECEECRGVSGPSLPSITAFVS